MNFMYDSKKTLTYYVLFTFICLVCLIFIKSNTELPGPGSKSYLYKSKLEKIAKEKGIEKKDAILILLESDKVVTNSEIENFTTYLKNYKGIFENIKTAGSSYIDEAYFLSEDKKNVIFIAKTKYSLNESSFALKDFPTDMSQWAQKNNYEIYYLSQGTVSNEIFDMIHKDLDQSLYISVPITLLILVYVFKSFLLALVPLFIASTGLIISLFINLIISYFIPVSATSNQLLILLVLAIGVDYPLFFITRLREELKSFSYEVALDKTIKTTGRTIVWSGATVAISLLGLLVAGDFVLSSMAVSAFCSVVVTTVISRYLLPKVLLLFTAKNFKSKAPTKTKLNRFSVNYPKTSILASLLVLFSIMIFVRDIRLGSTMLPEILPANTMVHKTYDQLNQKFPNLTGVDLSLILKGENLEEKDDIIETFFEQISSEFDVSTPVEIEKSQDDTIYRYHLIFKGDANSEKNKELYLGLKNKYIPQYLISKNIEAEIGGTLPYIVEEQLKYAVSTKLVIISVLLFSFFILLFAFESIIIPIKAIILNLISTLTAFGFLVLCFQNEPTAIWNYSVIESFIPALLFAILFGLSMDYHVILISRIREKFLETNQIKESVVFGIESTGEMITSAALIMIAVFLVIASLRLPIMKELGVGLGVSILVDVTIIRNILLPSTMVLLGKWNWYLPKTRSFRKLYK